MRFSRLSQLQIVCSQAPKGFLGLGHKLHSEILSPPNLGPSPRDWRTLIHFNVVLTVFHIDHIFQGVCKTVRTTFQCIVVVQLWGEGPENLSHSYVPFQDLLPGIGEQQYIKM